MSIKKNPQHILAVANNYFDLHNDLKSHRKPSVFGLGLTNFAIEKFLDEVSEHVFINERARLETDPSYRQIIPYMTFSQKGDDGVARYIPYLRTPKAGEAGLVGKVSIGFGGHVDAKDVVYDNKSILDLRSTIIEAAAREKNEEIRPVYVIDIERFNRIPVEFASQFIRLDANPVDAVHIGIVMNAVLPADLPIMAGDEELQLLPAMTVSELLEAGNSGKYELENWTRVILEAEQVADRQIKTA